MNINSTRPNKKSKRIAIFIVAVVILVLTYVSVAYFSRWWPFLSSTSTPTDSQTQSSQQTEDQTAEKNQQTQDKQEFLDKEDSDSETPSTPSQTTDNTVSLHISDDDDSLIVQTRIDGIVSGTCTLTLSNSTQTVTKTAEIMYAPEYSSCAGFTVAKSELGTGVWSITLTATGQGTTVKKTTSYTL